MKQEKCLLALRNWLLVHAAIVLFVISQTGCSLFSGFLANEACSDTDRGAVPAPPGERTTDWQAAQAAAALQDQTTFYRADFVGDSPTPSPGAIDKIARAIGNSYDGNPWIIEPSGDSRLDDARKFRITQILEANGVVDPIVLPGVPRAIGTPGPFAESAIRGSFGGRTFQRGVSGTSFRSTGIGR